MAEPPGREQPPTQQRARGPRPARVPRKAAYLQAADRRSGGQCGSRANTLKAGLRLPAAVRKPDCQPTGMFVSSRRMNQTIKSIRGFARAMPKDWRTYAAWRVYETPKRRSGGVCQAYSVIQIRFLPHSRLTWAMSVLMLPSVMADPPGFDLGVSLGLP